MSPVFPRFFLVSLMLLLQGCSVHHVSDSELRRVAQTKLAANRAEFLMLSSQSSPLKILSVNTREATVNMTLQILTLTARQGEALPTFITETYCAERETRRLMEAGVNYHIAVFDGQPKVVSRFDVDVEQCD